MKEITIPNNYTGSLSQENEIVKQINESIISLEDAILNMPDSIISFDTHISDTEEYSIDIYFSENKTHATIMIVDGNLEISINEKTIKLDQDGNII